MVFLNKTAAYVPVMQSIKCLLKWLSNTSADFSEFIHMNEIKQMLKSLQELECVWAVCSPSSYGCLKAFVVCSHLLINLGKHESLQSYLQGYICK